MKPLPYRQIHLDFHTSPHISKIGEQFDSQQFIDTLKSANVNSINLFAKCHHGFYYYPTETGGRVHPHLKHGLDLFGEQIKACREAGMRVLAYTTIVWAEDTCDLHPEWMQVDPTGAIGSKPPFSSPYNTLENRGWRSLCMNNAQYRNYLKHELKEIYDRYHPDGYWIDIIWQFECVCPSCRASMKKLGLNPESHKDRRKHDRMVEIDFMQDTFSFLHDLDDGLEIYYNGTPAEFDLCDQPALSTREKRNNMDFVDIESLPSETWGYTHFPILANYINKYNQDYAMMNGRFHKTWGDFGTLRNQVQLEYECFRALAYGAASCIGDQLHPSGWMDETVYRRIGSVFAQIKQKEPWCLGSRKVSEIAVLAPNAVLEAETFSDAPCLKSKEGVYRMLSELHIPFDFVDFDDTIDGYKLLILPDCARLNSAMAEKVQRFTEIGGRLLITGNSGLWIDRDEYAIEGLEYQGMSPYCPSYVAIGDNFPEIPPMTYLLNTPSYLAKVSDAACEAEYVAPYFNRTWEHFCSHRQSPASGNTIGGAVYLSERIAFFGARIFEDYATNATLVHRNIISHLINALIANPLVQAQLPSTAEITLRSLNDSMILHILNYIPQRRCAMLDVIEDIIPLYNRRFKIRSEKEPVSVSLVPDGKSLAFTYEEGYISLTVPEIHGHQMVQICFPK